MTWPCLALICHGLARAYTKLLNLGHLLMYWANVLTISLSNQGAESMPGGHGYFKYFVDFKNQRTRNVDSTRINRNRPRVRITPLLFGHKVQGESCFSSKSSSPGQARHLSSPTRRTWDRSRVPASSCYHLPGTIARPSLQRKSDPSQHNQHWNDNLGGTGSLGLVKGDRENWRRKRSGR